MPLMSRGYKDYSRTLVLAQVDINQDLKFITEGLRTRTAQYDALFLFRFGSQLQNRFTIR